MENRYLAIFLATLRICVYVVLFPWFVVKRFTKNRKYDKYLRKRYKEGKEAFNTPRSVSYTRLNPNDYGKESYQKFPSR